MRAWKEITWKGREGLENRLQVGLEGDKGREAGLPMKVEGWFCTWQIAIRFPVPDAQEAGSNMALYTRRRVQLELDIWKALVCRREVTGGARQTQTGQR